MIIPMLLSGTIWAQGSQPVPESAPSQDAFAGWRASLSDAADRALAAARSGPAMDADEDSGSAGRGAAGRSSTTTTTTLSCGFALLFQRVQQLRPTIEPILRQEGVPAELSAIVLVESGGQRHGSFP